MTWSHEPIDDGDGRRSWLSLAPAGGLSDVAAAAARLAADSTPAWLGEELPLPLSVKTPQDLALKAVAERQYLVFNLLARGKLAWDAGDFATAAGKWEALLRVPGIDPELDRVVRPLAVEARARAGKGAAAAPPRAARIAVAAPAASGPSPPAAAPVQPLVNVSGQIGGGGHAGPRRRGGLAEAQPTEPRRARRRCGARASTS